MKRKDTETEVKGGDKNSLPVLTPGIGTRIEEVAKMLGGNAAAGRASFKSDIQIGRYIKEKSTPTIDVIVALSRATGVSIEWLATGEGPKRRSEDDSLADKDLEAGVHFSLVPHYDVEASAGNGRTVQRESEIGKLAFRRDWLRQKGLQAKDLVVIRIAGDSMSPTVRDGSLVLVDTRQEHVKSDGIYALLVDGDLVAKRLQIDLAGGGLYIRSDNPAYREQHLTQEQARLLYIVGRVIWAGGEL